jgi:hypothetical protein
MEKGVKIPDAFPILDYSLSEWKAHFNHSEEEVSGLQMGPRDPTDPTPFVEIDDSIESQIADGDFWNESVAEASLYEAKLFQKEHEALFSQNIRNSGDDDVNFSLVLTNTLGGFGGSLR